MRQPIVFSRLPDTARLPGGAVSAKIVPVKAVLPVSAEHVQRLRHVASGIRPHVLAQFFRLMSGVNAPNLSSMLRGSDRPVPVRVGYNYYVIGEGKDQIAQLWHRDELIASGTTMELFIFAMKEHFGAAPVILSELRGGADYVHTDVSSGKLAELLVQYREVRRCSPGLNKITKIAQLDAIDYDHVSLKFEAADFLSSSDIRILHPGSGPLGGTHMLFEQPVVLVDPLIKWEGQGYDEYRSAKYCDDIAGEFHAVISDAASGDDLGLGSGTTIAPSHYCAFAKLDLQDPTGPRGFLVRKPRPHNSEVIWEISDEGQSWEEQRPGLVASVLEANRRRMENFMNLRGTTAVLPSAVGRHKLARIARRAYRVPRPAGAHLTVPQNARPEFSKTSQRRVVEFRKVCQDTTYEEFERWCGAPRNWCKLPRERLVPGSVLRLDCGFGSALFSLRSILLSARLYDWTVLRNGYSWLIWPPDSRPPGGF